MFTPRRQPLCLLACALAISLTVTSQAMAERVTLDKPVKVTAVKTDKSKLNGRVTSYDETSFELLKGATGDKDKAEVNWSELDATNIFAVRSALIVKPTGADWIKLGRDMRAVPGGEKLAETAFTKALKLDPKLKDAVEAARKEEIAPAGASPMKADGGDAGASNPSKTGTAGGPQVIGASTEKTWKVLTPDEMTAATKSLDAFAAETGDKMKIQLARYETKYFLFYSDLAQPEAKKWADLLDKMYARLAELFAIDKGVNVWRGKALVFVFSQSKDYQRFQRVMHDTDPGGSAGMCHSFGNGDVHIAFYRQPEELTFAHVLVHESVHGFLHRFKTPVPIPSWVNEGLAETIGTELVPRPARVNEVTSYAKQGLKQNRGLGGILEAQPIVAWQYPVAETMTEFMIKSNKRHYVDFIIGIKEGLTWEESLDQRYKAPKEKLVRAYGESLGINNLAQ